MNISIMVRASPFISIQTISLFIPGESGKGVEMKKNSILEGRPVSAITALEACHMADVELPIVFKHR